MANEAVLVVRTADPVNFTVADGTGIEKGALLKVTDPNVAAAADGNTQPLAGIAAREKVASSGRTTLAVYQQGEFLMYASGSIAIGSKVRSISGFPNFVQSATGTITSGSAILGTCKETASNAEQVLIKVGIGQG